MTPKTIVTIDNRTDGTRETLEFSLCRDELLRRLALAITVPTFDIFDLGGCYLRADHRGVCLTFYGCCSEDVLAEVNRLTAAAGKAVVA